MKKAVFIFVEVLFKIFSGLFPYSILAKYHLFKSRVYSLWVKNEFLKCGRSNFSPPFTLKGGRFIIIGDRVNIGARAILCAWDSYAGIAYNPVIRIGSFVSIGEDSHISAINNITIGNHVLMGKKVTISDNAHGQASVEDFLYAPVARILFSKGPVIIEDNVWIGDKATILGGVRIGSNSIIGANSVVTKDVPPNCVAAGCPAIIIKKVMPKYSI